MIKGEYKLASLFFLEKLTMVKYELEFITKKKSYKYNYFDLFLSYSLLTYTFN